MTKQEVERMLIALEGIAERIGTLCTDIADISDRLDDLCECIGTTDRAYGSHRYLRIIDIDRHG